MSVDKKAVVNTDKQNVILTETEEERLRKDIYRSDKEKFELFCIMLRHNKFYNKAKITHK